MKEAVAFAEHAARFCEFIENCSKLPLDERLAKARVLLVELYRAALELIRSASDRRFGAEASEAC